MNPLLEQLHNIEGLHPISNWPLASGMWILIIGVALILVAGVAYIIKRILYKRSWKYDAWLELCHLEKNLSPIQLSECIRRIAVQRFSRKTCAGLSGRAWLKWLKENDPKGFDWETKGRPLIDAPYAPVDQQLTPEELKDFIEAMKRWVR